MTEQRWTFVCVSEDKRPARQFSVSARALRYAPSLAAAAATVLSALAVIVAMDMSARFEVSKLRGEKAAISRGVESIRMRVGLIEGSIDGFIENDEQFRVVTGLGPIDAEIFEVGVGGPGMTTPVSNPMWETDPVTAEALFTVAYDLSALEQNEVLAQVGSTGTATASHLHYEVWRDGEATDPGDYILNGVIP
jgi:hypothetical protein